MRGYFHVDVRDEECTGIVADYRCLFKSPGAINNADLVDCLELSLRRTVHPDAVVFICIPAEVQPMLEAFQNDDGVKQALERASSKVCVAVCEINQKGDIGKPKYIRNERVGLPLIEIDKQEKIFLEGIHRLFDSANVLCPAPAGFAYVKPSKKRAKYFLRAEAALYETERVHFLAFSLMRKIAKREEEAKEPIGAIFVDTMAIASLAYVLRELYHELYGYPKPRVESFHSYVGIKDVGKPRPGTSLCIISASSSMSMQRDWQQMTYCLPSEVLTLVTLKNAKDSNLALYAFDKVDPLEEIKASSGLRDLRIVGESFTPEDIPPKPVLLTVKAHRDKKWFEIGQKYSEAKLFSLMKASRPTDKVRPIFIEGMKLLEQEGFGEFLKREVMQRVPITVQAIIFQDDQASEELAKECVLKIQEISPDKKVQITGASNLEKVKLNKDDALLIVAAVIGCGTRLRSINRDLRNIHNGARHYLIGFQLGDSINDYIQLRKDLEFSAVKSSITISVMEHLAIGRTVGDAYGDEEKLMANWHNLPALPGIRERIEEIRGRQGFSNGAFLPSTTSGNTALKLRTDFAYWKGKYSLSFDHSAAVLLTAASMLQYAREFKNFTDDNFRLASDTFQQVVLDPENFARYNDGVIQAALLRAARPSELDYSSSEEISRRMTEMLSGIFRFNSRQQGEAALEFALALKTERMKLSAVDMKRLKDEVKELSGEDQYIKLMKDLLDVGQPNAWGQGIGI